jgi:hypothetical protein
MTRAALDIASIDHLIAAYNYFGDLGQVGRVAALFTDGVLEPSGGAPWRGRDEIERQLAAGQLSRRTVDPRLVRLCHHVSVTEVRELRPTGTVRARSAFLVLSRYGRDQWGVYTDTMTRVDGTWMFAWRKVSLDGVASTSWRHKLLEDPPQRMNRLM